MVRAWRTDARSPVETDGHDVVWGGLRGYLEEEQDWPPVTLIAMRLRATGNLSRQASRQVSVIATRKLPVWTGSEWTAPQPTRSIARALADMARSAEYGPGLPDGQIDIAGLAALDALWTGRGDVCDIRIADAGSWWEAAARVALVGRARVCMQGGVLRTVRDGPETVPVAPFGQRNIVEGSFSVDWLMPAGDQADVVEVSYLDAQTWQAERVTAQRAGRTAARPATLRLDGATSRDQALREGLSHAACTRYRRRFLRFATEMEGFIPSLGDPIAVQHDLVGWGTEAEAVAWDADARRLTLSRPLDWSGSGHVVGLRRRDGSLAGPFAAARGGSDRVAILAVDPGFAPDTGAGRVRTIAAFGRAQARAALGKVASIRPRDSLTVEIEAVVEDPAVHLAEGGVREEVEAGWVRATETVAAHVLLRPPYGPRTRVRVRAIGRAAGPWATLQAGVARPIVRLIRHCAAAVDAHVEAQARAPDHTGAAHPAGYLGSGIPQWAAEAAAFLAWRDAVWQTALGLLDTADPAAPPTVEDVLAALPPWAAAGRLPLRSVGRPSAPPSMRPQDPVEAPLRMP